MRFPETREFFTQFLELALFTQFQQALQPWAGTFIFVVLAGWLICLGGITAECRWARCLRVAAGAIGQSRAEFVSWR